MNRAFLCSKCSCSNELLTLSADVGIAHLLGPAEVEGSLDFAQCVTACAPSTLLDQYNIIDSSRALLLRSQWRMLAVESGLRKAGERACDNSASDGQLAAQQQCGRPTQGPSDRGDVAIRSRLTKSCGPQTFSLVM